MNMRLTLGSGGSSGQEQNSSRAVQPGMSYPVQNLSDARMQHPYPMPAAAMAAYNQQEQQARQMGYTAPQEDFLPEENFRSRNGRFMPRAGGWEDEEGMMLARMGKGRRSGMSMGHAETSDSDEEIEKICREMKRVKRRLQELEEALEEKEQSGRRRKKRKPEKDDEDEDDEEDDAPRLRALGKGLMSAAGSLPALLEDALAVLENPPDTWKPYAEKKDFGGVARMEFGELVKAVEQHKDAAGLKKELNHTAAALLQLCAHAGEKK